MTIVQLPECGGHDLTWADRLRKAIAKKNPAAYNELTNEFFETVEDQNLSRNFCNYVWNVLVATSRGYGFNLSHTLAYSLVALQEMNLAYKYPTIYWNCANLIVDSGGSESIDNDKSTNYDKVATAINRIQYSGVNVSLVDINKSTFTFSPDEETNSVLYGLKPVSNVNSELVERIISNRPYSSLQDFMGKVPCDVSAMTCLIKSGAFDCFDERKKIMEEYIWSVCKPKQRITMQNFNGLIEHNLIPKELEFQKRLFIFNKFLKKNCKAGTEFYTMNSNYYEFYEQFFDIDALVPWERGLAINQSAWKKMYDKEMEPAKEYLKKYKNELLDALNLSIFQQCWDKYAAGNYSSWEMESAGFYYHDHELKNVDKDRYNIYKFDSLGEEPIVDYYFKKKGNQIPIYKTQRICGTVIAKDDNKNTVNVITPDSGVVTVKFTRDYYARLNKQLSQVGTDGVKHTMEKGWFKKGTLLVVNGFRRGNTFVAKAYKKSNSHQCYRITEVKQNGELNMTHLRYGEAG